MKESIDSGESVGCDKTKKQPKTKPNREWYRKTTWNEEDEQDFFSHLKRARGDGNKTQYLKIQAYHLIENNLYDSAEMIVNYYLHNYPEDRFNKSMSLQMLGQIYEVKKEYNKAFDYYSKAMMHEIEYPQVNCGAWLDYCVFVVKRNKKELFEKIKDIIFSHYQGLMFYNKIYRASAVLAIVYKSQGDMKLYEHYKKTANNAADEVKSGFSYHPGVGLAIRDKELDKLIEE